MCWWNVPLGKSTNLQTSSFCCLIFIICGVYVMYLEYRCTQAHISPLRFFTNPLQTFSSAIQYVSVTSEVKTTCSNASQKCLGNCAWLNMTDVYKIPFCLFTTSTKNIIKANQNRIEKNDSIVTSLLWKQTILSTAPNMKCLCPSDGDRGEWGIIWRPELWTSTKATVESHGETVLFLSSQANGACFLYVCAGLTCCYDTEHCGGDAVQGTEKAPWLTHSYIWTFR